MAADPKVFKKKIQDWHANDSHGWEKHSSALFICVRGA